MKTDHRFYRHKCFSVNRQFTLDICIKKKEDKKNKIASLWVSEFFRWSTWQYSLTFLNSLCIQQKEKNPQAAQEIRVGIKKRSELTGKLLDEAQKLESQEGRKQVKTRVEKSPFVAVNNAAVHNQGGFNKNGRGSKYGQKVSHGLLTCDKVRTQHN